MNVARKLSPLAALAALAALAVAGPVLAQTVTIGTASESNCIPFGCAASPFNISRYQQVFSASAFGASPLDIMSLTFSDAVFPNTGDFSDATYSFFFSTTSAPVNGLSTDLASNVGTPDSPFATAVLTGGAIGTLMINGSGYVYDPTAGNLLMDVVISSASPNPTFNFGGLDADASGTVTSRAWDQNGLVTADAVGLVTEFGYTAVTPTPEPTTLALMATGLVGIAGWTRRRKRAPE